MVILTSALAPLALLACPVGMGLCMWMMMRGSRRQPQEPQQLNEQPSQPQSIELLREEQRRLGEEIDRLEQRESGGIEAGEPR